MRRFSVKGFTLLELMIATAVVAIIASLAYPSYLNHVRKTKRSEAKSALLNIAGQQQMYLMEQKTYTDALTDLNYPTDQISTERGLYDVKVAAPTANCPVTECYLLEAQAVGAQLDDTNCATMTLSSSSEK